MIRNGKGRKVLLRFLIATGEAVVDITVVHYLLHFRAEEILEIILWSFAVESLKLECRPTINESQDHTFPRSVVTSICHVQPCLQRSCFTVLMRQS
jgi:hypothetical protein